MEKEGAGVPARLKRRTIHRMAKTKQDTVRIIPLGGLDGIGKNMTVIEYRDEMILVDAGLMFSDDAHPGIDLILPDYSYVVERKENLKGIIITHGHEDHTGALPYLLKDLGGENSIPIHGTKLTLGLIKGKLEEHKIMNPRFREIVPGGHVTLGGFGCDFFSVNHSIPGAVGVFIRTPVGNILHTGDFKIDLTPIDGVMLDYAALSRFQRAGVDLMLSDSTNANVNEFTKSEAAVGVVLRDLIERAQQRVIVACFASHIHRIQQVCDAAVASGRKVVVTGRSMVTNTKIARELGYLRIDEDDIIDAFDVKDMASDEIVVLCTGSQGEPLSALARMANGDHRTVRIQPGDTVIISATPVPGNERAVTRVVNGLAKIGAQVYDRRSHMVHVSGHAGAEELKLMMSLLEPTAFLPVHGEVTHLAAHARLARDMGVDPGSVFVLENGESIELSEQGCRIGSPVKSGVIYVDGLSVGDIREQTLRDRQQLSSDGTVTVVVSVKKGTGKMVGEPRIVTRGLVGADDPEVREAVTARLRKALEKSSGQGRQSGQDLESTVREVFSNFIWERMKRRPLVVAVMVEV